jgi:hypothetical protein
MTLYHGTPHTFAPVPENPVGKFDLAKIGTGEGAQAYGHGIYVAESPRVAGQYRDAFAINHDAKVITEAGETLNVPTWVQRRMESGDVDSVIQDFSSRLKEANDVKANSMQPWLVDDQIDSMSRILKAANEFKAGKATTQPSAHLYHVDIPDEHIDKMLDWDKPLSDPKLVDEIAAMHKAARPMDNVTREDIRRTGFTAYSALTDALGSQVQASEWLLARGYPGIKYLDAGSRGAGQGSRNFVLFDPDIARIVGKE